MDIKFQHIKIPNKVPIFPLSNAILFPNIELPLYIYEPRYIQMIEHSLNTHRMLCLSLIKDGWEFHKEPFPSYNTCGLGIVKFAKFRKDGTINIILKGIARVNITHYSQYRPYRIAQISTINETLFNHHTLALRIKKTKDLIIKRLQLDKNYSSHIEKEINKLKDFSLLCDMITYYSSMPSNQKQDILETPNINLRLKKLQSFLVRDIYTIKNQATNN